MSTNCFNQAMRGRWLMRRAAHAARPHSPARRHARYGVVYLGAAASVRIGLLALLAAVPVRQVVLSTSTHCRPTPAPAVCRAVVALGPPVCRCTCSRHCLLPLKAGAPCLPGAERTSGPRRARRARRHAGGRAGGLQIDVPARGQLGHWPARSVFRPFARFLNPKP
jgi:hypothetical protein